MIEYVPTEIRYDKARIFRRLKIEKDTPVYEYSDRAFPRLEEIVRENLFMTHCFTVPEKPMPLGIDEIDTCDRQVVCLSSCRDDIMDAISRLLDAGDYLEGYILNDMTNEIIFNASDQMNHNIAQKLKPYGYFLSRRFSPGEEEMVLDYQSTLLSYFREDPALDFVQLTKQFMLIPEKSMLYVFGADPKNPEISIEHDCRVCPNVKCFFREVKEESHV